jgi:hypothetical protein
MCAVGIISQAPLGAVKSMTARPKDLAAINKMALFTFPFASPYTRQIARIGPEDMRRGPTLRPYALQDYLVTPT